MTAMGSMLCWSQLRINGMALEGADFQQGMRFSVVMLMTGCAPRVDGRYV